MFQRYFLLVMCLMFTGCLDFGPNITTTAPSAEDVRRCRAEMYIDADIEIVPEGFKLTSGLDDAIWFRFIAKTDTIAEVFVADTVDTSKFTADYKLNGNSMPSWWDTASKSLAGGQVDLPNVRFMHVGYADNGDGTLTVYVMWHEM